MALTNKLKAIADAIRAKTGSTEKLTLDGMASAISNISTGGGEVPSFHFTGNQLQNLFINDRLSQLHDIGYTTSDITNLNNAYYSVNRNTVNTPTINIAANHWTTIDCSYAFQNANLGTVNINFEGVATNIKTESMFNNYSGKNINFIGVPKIECYQYGGPKSMFYNAARLEEIPQLNFVRYDSSSELRFDEIFTNCWKLKHRDDEIIIDHADFYNNGATKVRLTSIFNSNYSMEKIPEWLYGFRNSPNLFTYSNLSFSSCYSLQDILLPMSNNVAYNTGYMFDYNCSTKSMKFQTQEDGTPYTANWSNSFEWNLTPLGAWMDTNNYQYTSYKIRDDNYDDHSFNSAAEFIDFAETLSKPTEIGYSYTNGSIISTSWSSSTNNNGYFTRFWDYKLVYCWSLEDAQAIRARGYIPYGISYIYSLYNHDSAVETINSLPDCSGCAAQTIKFSSNAGSAYGKAISNLTEAEIAVATAKNWTVALK